MVMLDCWLTLQVKHLSTILVKFLIYFFFFFFHFLNQNLQILITLGNEKFIEILIYSVKSFFFKKKKIKSMTRILLFTAFKPLIFQK